MPDLVSHSYNICVKWVCGNRLLLTLAQLICNLLYVYFFCIDPSLNLSTFVGHTDAVWDIRLFPLSISSSQLLGSISADGTVKIWDTETKGSPLKSSWSYHGSDASSATASTGPKLRPVPTGLDFCPTDLKKMVVSYSNSVIKLFDIETGKDILTFKSNETYGTCETLVLVV